MGNRQEVLSKDLTNFFIELKFKNGFNKQMFQIKFRKVFFSINYFSYTES